MRFAKSKRVTLAEVEAAFDRWLGDPDPLPTRIVLTAAVAHRLPGDPCWLMLIGGSSYGKTERLGALGERKEPPAIVAASSISGEAALLSGTAKKDKAADATGGLLMQLPIEGGVLLLKEFNTILSMHRDKRAELLAALREIHDGRWVRNIGADGGRTLQWQGKLTVLAGCTTAIDQAYTVMGTMGPRFVFVRLQGDEDSAANSAYDTAGKEAAMKAELRATVRALYDDPPGHPLEEGQKLRQRTIGMAKLVTAARSTVDRDFRHEVTLVHDTEGPPRFLKHLITLWRGAGLIGLSETDALKLLWRVSLDSLPKLRRACLSFLVTQTGVVTTGEVAKYVDHPTNTTQRALEEMAAHRVLAWDRAPEHTKLPHRWRLSDKALGWLDAAGVRLASKPTVVVVVKPPPAAAPGNGQAHDADEWHDAPAVGMLPPVELDGHSPPPQDDPDFYWLEFYDEPRESEPLPEDPDDTAA